MQFHNCMKIGLSIPKQLIDQIDTQRGDVTRSKYVSRMLETMLEVKEKCVSDTMAMTQKQMADEAIAGVINNG